MPGKRPPKVCSCGASFQPRPSNYAKQFRCHECRSKRQSAGRDNQVKRHQKILDRLVGFWDGEGINETHETVEYVDRLVAADSDEGLLYIPTTEEVAGFLLKHRYVYLGAAFSDGTARRLEAGREGYITTERALWWLWTMPRGASMWGYSLGYDWTMIFTDLLGDLGDDVRQTALWQIYHPEIYPDKTPRDPFTPVWWRDWGICKTQAAVELHRKVEAKLLAKPPRDAKPDDLVDVSKFYADGFKCWGGGSFVQQITDWKVGTSEERELVAAMKKQRSHFGMLTDEVRGYCDLECRLGAERARAHLVTASELGIRAEKWYSVGSGAKALMKKHRVVWKEDGEWTGYRGPDRYAGAPQHLHADITRAFFGGHFEIRVTGYFAVLFLYDLSSAYPAIIKDLPCMLHGEWCGEYVPGGVNFGQVRWEPDHTGDTTFGPFPWRWPDQRIYYPEMGEGVYCEAEIRAAQKLTGFNIEEVRWFGFKPTCTHRPFQFIEDLFQVRLEWGSDGRGLVLKITMNAIYGTLADTVSPDSIYASVPWAAIITGSVRARLLEFIAEHHDVLVGFATDSAFTRAPVESVAGRRIWQEDDEYVLPSGKVITGKAPLGEWGTEGVLHNCLMPQPGVYTADEGPSKKRHRTRGHNMDDLLRLRAELSAEWDLHGWDAEVSYKRTRFTGAKQALARKFPQAVYGQWVESDVKISFKPSNRHPLPGKEPVKYSVATSAHLCNPEIPALSSPYDRLVALETYSASRDRQEENEVQPDW